MHVGVAYYPEYWPEGRWAEDARLMQAAHVNIVRVAEFAWSRLEPRDNEFNLDWLERAIELLAQHGISTLLCTPTAVPPPWMTTAHRDILPKDDRGTTKEAGGRRAYCPNSVTYRRFCERVVRKMAERFGRNPRVVAWQLDNEFGCHDTTFCYCDACCERFRGWLKRKYGTIVELNRRWGTAFWSSDYSDWGEVPLPWYSVAGHSPSLELDFKRFATDSYVEFATVQTAVLHELAPGQPITTNFMGRFDELDAYRIADVLDLVAWDNYPGYDPKPYVPALGADITRGIAGGKPVWVVEEQVGPVCWAEANTQPRPGQVRLWTYQQIAYGADAILFFRWRGCTAGKEKGLTGVLSYDGVPDSRAYEDLTRVGEELGRIGDELVGARVPAEVAMIYSYEDLWAADFKPRPTHRLTWLKHFELYYAALHRANVAVDLVEPTGDLGRYKLVVAPMLQIVTPEIAANLKDFVATGGTFVTTLFSGYCDECAVITEQPLPGELRALLGIRVKEFDPFAEGLRNSLRRETASRMATGTTPAFPRAEYGADYWADVIELEGAEAVLRFRRDYHAEGPAVTVNTFGKGAAVYVGTVGDEWFFEDLVSWLVQLAGLSPPIGTPPGLQHRVRESDMAIYRFFLNHNDTSVSVELTGELFDVLRNTQTRGKVVIGPHDVLLLKEVKRGPRAAS